MLATAAGFEVARWIAMFKCMLSTRERGLEYGVLLL